MPNKPWPPRSFLQLSCKRPRPFEQKRKDRTCPIRSFQLFWQFPQDGNKSNMPWISVMLWVRRLSGFGRVLGVSWAWALFGLSWCYLWFLGAVMESSWCHSSLLFRVIRLSSSLLFLISSPSSFCFFLFFAWVLIRLSLSSSNSFFEFLFFFEFFFFLLLLLPLLLLHIYIYIYIYRAKPQLVSWN